MSLSDSERLMVLKDEFLSICREFYPEQVVKDLDTILTLPIVLLILKDGGEC